MFRVGPGNVEPEHVGLAVRLRQSKPYGDHNSPASARPRLRQGSGQAAHLRCRLVASRPTRQRTPCTSWKNGWLSLNQWQQSDLVKELRTRWSASLDRHGDRRRPSSHPFEGRTTYGAAGRCAPPPTTGRRSTPVMAGIHPVPACQVTSRCSPTWTGIARGVVEGAARRRKPPDTGTLRLELSACRTEGLRSAAQDVDNPFHQSQQS